jgi:serine/threonine protein kinase/Tol biopolymer transport system component
MQDLIGRTLGHYRIVEKLGEGGMGEVYRARDERLDRDVAIKVIHEAVAQDEERLARFEREAKLLASLNHPNIATLHGLEKEEGRSFLVMELVEGENLAGVLARGAIPVDDALPIALQITKALETAHQHGIVHRDLKPANVMVDSEGIVKVLDFGLARAFDPSDSHPSSPESIAESPTLTAQLTRADVVLGTAPYASPEQARGRTVDKQADIWAFGCVLYEVLTGVRAFRGDTVTDVVAGVIERDPEWELLPAPTPQKIRHLLRRCLHKNQKDRLHDIADARIVIQEVIESPSESTSDEAKPKVRKKAAVGLLGIIGAVLAAVVLTIAVMLFVGTVGQPVDQDTTRFTVNLPAGAQLHVTSYGNPLAISPNGRRVVFAATVDGTRQLFQRPIASFDFAPIAGTEGASNPVFSPDSSWVAFSAGGMLKKVSLADGFVVTICDALDMGALCWASDNRLLFTSRSEVFSVSASGGQPEIVSIIAPKPSLMAYSTIDSVRDGKIILLTYSTGGGSQSKLIDIVSTASGNRRTLIERGEHGQFSSSNHLVFARGHSLMATPLDLDRLELNGPAVQVFQGSGFGDHEATYSAPFQISETGTLVYAPNVLSRYGQPVWVDRRGRVERILKERRPFGAPTISPDGQRLAMSTTEHVMETWILDLDRSALSRFTFQGSNHFNVWTPDGKHLAFSSNRDGSYNLYLKPADGGATTERLTVSDWHQDPGSWSPDGRILAFAQNHPETTWDIWLAHVGDEPRQEAFISTQFSEYHPMISPDGQWLAYQSDETGRFEVYVQPFPDGGKKWLVSAGGGTQPLWARNGEELFYRYGKNIMAASIRPGPNFEAETPELLFEFPYLAASGYGSPDYDITPDGQRFVMIETETQVPRTEFYVVVNWLEELKRLVPAE